MLVFEHNVAAHQVEEWLATFNSKKRAYSLELHATLINDLYVIKVTAENLEIVVTSLIASSPLHTVEVCIAVNSYPTDFDPKNPANFKQLINVQIAKGSPFIYTFLDAILQPLGKVVEGNIASGAQQHWIKALVVWML